MTKFYSCGSATVFIGDKFIGHATDVQLTFQAHWDASPSCIRHADHTEAVVPMVVTWTPFGAAWLVDRFREQQGYQAEINEADRRAGFRDDDVCPGCYPGGRPEFGTPISQLSGRCEPGEPGWERFKAIAASWGYD